MGIIRFIRCIILLIVSGVALLIGLSYGFTEIRYLFEGNLTNASVTEREHTKDSRGNDSYELKYSYTTHYGEQYNGIEFTTYDAYYLLKEGNKFQIEYLSSSPSTSERIGSYSNIRIAGTSLAISFLCLVGAIWLFARAGRMF